MYSTLPPAAGQADPDQDLSAAAAVMERLLGFVVTQAIGAAVELEIPDIVAAGPQRLADIAAESGTDPVRLRQLLRCLTQAEILAEPSPDVFAPTALSRALETGRAGSLAPYATLTCRYSYPVAAQLVPAVQTGTPGEAFPLAHGAPFFEFFRADPAAGAVFDHAMAASSAGMSEAVAAVDYTGCTTVVDVGGGNGALLATVLQRHQGLRGVLAEQPHVLAAAGQKLESAGVADRCTLVECDFFAEVPAGGDVYVLSRILHDWSDDEARAILRKVRAAMRGHGRLLIVDRALSDYDERHWDKHYDLLISLLLTGHERTRAQWEQLLAAEGFTLTGVSAAGWRSHLLQCAAAG